MFSIRRGGYLNDPRHVAQLFFKRVDVLRTQRDRRLRVGQGGAEGVGGGRSEGNVRGGRAKGQAPVV